MLASKSVANHLRRPPSSPTFVPVAYNVRSLVTSTSFSISLSLRVVKSRVPLHEDRRTDGNTPKGMIILK